MGKIKFKVTKEMREKLKVAQSFVANSEKRSLGDYNLSDYVQIVVENGTVVLRTTNGISQYFETLLETENVSGEGSFIVNTKLLNSLVGKKEDTVVTYSDDSQTVKILGDGSRISIKSSVVPFPAAPEMSEGAYTVSIPVGKLVEGFSKVNYAVYTGEKLEQLAYTGVRIDYFDKTLSFSAMDGARLVYTTIPADCVTLDNNIIVPQWLSRFVSSVKWDDKDMMAIIMKDDSRVGISIGNVSIISNRYRGEFRELKPLADEPRWWIEVNREKLLNTLQEIKAILPAKMSTASATVFDFQPENNGTLDIRTAQVLGEVWTSFSYEVVEGEIPKEFKSAFNPKYVEDAVKALPRDAEKALLGFSARMRPIAICTRATRDCLHLIAPVIFSEY
ncbi:MAG: hypothetical protein RR415_06085 [Ruthenibacterium sp.]